jgi:hypothetical protein
VFLCVRVCERWKNGRGSLAYHSHTHQVIEHEVVMLVLVSLVAAIPGLGLPVVGPLLVWHPVVIGPVDKDNSGWQVLHHVPQLWNNRRVPIPVQIKRVDPYQVPVRRPHAEQVAVLQKEGAHCKARLPPPRGPQHCNILANPVLVHHLHFQPVQALKTGGLVAGHNHALIGIPHVNSGQANLATREKGAAQLDVLVRPRQPNVALSDYGYGRVL